MASGEEEVILDSGELSGGPETPKVEGAWMKYVRYLAVLCFIIGLLLRLGGGSFTSEFLMAGGMFFIVWSTGRFLTRYRYSKLEWLVFPGRVLLISGLVMRYLSDWSIAVWLVLAGLVLWSSAIMLSFNSGKETD
jgi:hypothetical protein